MNDKFSTYQTPKTYSRENGFPLNRLRGMIKSGIVPGFYSGTRFYIDVERFQAKLAEAAEMNARF